jgi:1-acyl-sn-glycerol-3-phosphate acyltransferase
MQAAKHIFVDRKNHSRALESLDKAVISINNNPRSILLFPEGTRSKDGKVHQFKKGGLLLGIKSQLPIVPMALCGTGSVALKGEWKLKSSKIELRIGKPIETKGMEYKDRNELTNLVYTEVLRLKNEYKN